MKKWNEKNIKEFVSSTEYELIDIINFDYSQSIIRIKCPKGHITDKKFYSFKQKQSCSECYNEKRSSIFRKDYEDVKKYIESIGYKMISNDYINNRTNIDIICDNGHEIQMTYDSLKSGKRCSICNKCKKHTIEYIKSELKKENYLLLSDNYLNNKQLLLMQCDKGHIFNMRFDHWANGIRCPLCKRSKGEEKISKILYEYNIKFNTQKTFEDCRNKRLLPFDFYLPSYNMVIEYDGEQHYKPCDFYGGKEAFDKAKIRDEIKTNYCKDNNIKLIRIPYWEFDNIENIIKKRIKIKII